MKRLALVVAVAACGGSPVMKPAVVVAQFEPGLTDPKLPLPNVLAVDPDTSLIDAADPADANDAEKAFYAWLRTLHGFPLTSLATVDFSGELNPDTVNTANVTLWGVTQTGVEKLTPKTISYDAEKRQVAVDYDWQPARTYAVTVMGGPSGVKGANGETVVGSGALDLLRAKYPLVSCSNLADPTCRSTNPGIRGKSFEDERKKALKMEKARLQAKPVLEAIEAGGAPRENLAALWSFRTQSHAMTNPTVRFDPAVRTIPFPCDALLKNGKVSVPAEDGDDALALQTKADLGELDGFSTTASIVTERNFEEGAVGLGLQASTLEAAQLQLLDLDDNNAAAPFTLVKKTNPDQVVLKPTRALKGHHRYAVLWTKGAKALDGRDVTAAPALAMLSAGAPFVGEDGKSRIRTLDDGRAGDLERLRRSVAAAVAAADAKGVARGDLLHAWSFTTVTTGPTLVELKDKPAQWNLPTAASDTAPLALVNSLNLVSAFSGKDFHSQVREGREGTFITGNALNLEGTELDLTNPNAPVAAGTEGPFTASGLATPRQEALKFLLVLPRTPKHADGRIPIIIFQHGITRWRRDSLFIANSIARGGFAMLAIDHPMHGDRSYCTKNADCAMGAMCTGHRCPPGQYAPTAGTEGMLLGTPAVTGLKFSSTTNLAATRDQIRQLIIDTAQLVRVVKDTTAGIGALNVDDPGTAVVERLDTTELGYIGMSLGSVMGSLAVAANPDITRAVFNVGGASPADILSQAQVAFLAEKKQRLDAYLLAARGIAAGTQRYDDFYDIARWMLDTADVQNFGRNYIDEPLPSYPKKRIFVQWVENDPWIPNATTQVLIDSIDRTSAPMNFGEHRWGGAAAGDHAFLMNPNFADVLMAQDECVSWVGR
ncbi:MAG: hypothetical protein JNK82_16140 [Myxococcaceae bacterium]|nr:hypothetical protein [Myxococcaceae bacterium]